MVKTKSKVNYDPDKDPTGAIGHKLAENIYLRKMASEYEEAFNKKNSRENRYKEFYNNWVNQHINDSDFRSDSKYKRNSLLIFPTFQEGGAKAISNMSDVQVGALYKTMLDAAKKKVKK